MQKIQTQGVHHITLVGASRQVSIDFWEGVLGMPFIFEQPNLDNPDESHLYFDPGDGRLITVFTNETREIDTTPNPEGIDRGIFHSIYFRDPLGQRIELACYKFRPPVGVSHAQVLLEAHRLRVAEGAYNIKDAHLANAIELLIRRTQPSLSEDREARHAYAQEVAGP